MNTHPQNVIVKQISSSNILSQPGATFGSNNNGSNNSNQQQPLDSRNLQLLHQQANNNSKIVIVENVGASNENSYSVPNHNQIQNQIKLLATPLRQPSSSANIRNPLSVLPDRADNQQQQQPVLTRARTSTNVVEQSNYYNQYHQLQNQQPQQNQQQQVRLKSAASLTDCSRLASSNSFNNNNNNYNKISESSSSSSSSPLGIGNKIFIAGQSTTLTAFNVKNLAANSLFPQSRNLPQDDEEQRVRLCYGVDSEKIQASAVIIQRAFRKYQICKRFKILTNQLRLNTSTSSNETSGISLSINTSDSLLSSTKQSDESTNELSYAITGTTRAAAWESLSYAASRLAAAAAKQQQQQQQLSNTKQSHQQQTSQSRTTTTITSTTTGSSNQNTTPIIRNKQQDPVVAAAINFQQLESIRKRQYRVGLNIFNKNPEKGVSFLIAHSFIDSSSPYTKTSTSYYHSNQLHFIDSKQNHHHQLAQQLALPTTTTTTTTTIPNPNDNLTSSACQICFEEDNLKRNVAHFLLHRKGLAKEKIGAYLGNLQSKFNQDVLKYYLQELDFNGLQIDLALRKFLSTFRLPGEAQKIEAIVDNFAQRYVQCQQQQQSQCQQNGLLPEGNVSQTSSNHQHQMDASNYKNNLILLGKDEIFILTFAIIMLNTDLHSPSLKPTSRMSSGQFVNNLRGVFKSQNINESDLLEIYERVKANQIVTTPDHVTHVMKVQQGLTVTNFQKKELPNLCVPHRRLVCFCRLFEVYDVNKKERVGQHQREIFLFNDLLLVTKLVRRVRANTTQLYTYRQSISLQGLYVQLFQSAHYTYGIKLCQRSNDETLIMFNARNELDQSRFVDDLGESIAEMDEMENIKAHNIVETIHFKYQDRLRRHSMMHNNTNSIVNSANTNENQLQNSRLFNKMINKSCDIRITNSKQQQVAVEEQEEMEADEEEEEEEAAAAAAVADNLKNSETIKLEQQQKAELEEAAAAAAAEELSLNKSNHKQVELSSATPEPVATID